MRKQVLSALALTLVVLACAGEASALVQRTFVSGLGLDTNPCSRAEPCRTFAAAIAQTQAGGEVLALDTAGYGPVTITKAISLISPPGVYAGITTTVAGTNAITVSAGANDVVVLKGLSLSGLGLGSEGVQLNSGKALRVEGLTISGFTDFGIVTFSALTVPLVVMDSLIRDNGNSGILAFGFSGSQPARVTIDRTRLLGNVNHGLSAAQNSHVIVRDSLAAGNGLGGFQAGTSSSVVTLESCLASDNNYGLISAGLMRVAGTTVVGNTTGLFFVIPGSLLSRGNNTVEGNLTDGIFTAAFAAK